MKVEVHELFQIDFNVRCLIACDRRFEEPREGLENKEGCLSGVHCSERPVLDAFVHNGLQQLEAALVFVLLALVFDPGLYFHG